MYIIIRSVHTYQKQKCIDRREIVLSVYCDNSAQLRNISSVYTFGIFSPNVQAYPDTRKYLSNFIMLIIL